MYNRLGSYVEAEAALRQGIEVCRKVGNRMVEGYAWANLGYALSMQGRLDEAEQTLGHARESLLRPAMRGWTSWRGSTPRAID